MAVNLESASAPVLATLTSLRLKKGMKKSVLVQHAALTGQTLMQLRSFHNRAHDIMHHKSSN